MTNLKVRLTFTEEILGTASNDPEIYAEFIASKALDAPSMEDEIAAIGAYEVIEKNKTVFPRNKNDRPILYDYQVKGFFKDACSMLSRLSGKVDGKKKAVNESGKLTAFKKIIDGLIFVEPRMIPFEFNGEVGSCQRPLRAQTAQGERIALANSETIPEGAYVDLNILCLDESHVSAVKEWLNYGQFRGIGQWRNSGKGKFTWAELS